jgi:uncharacterized protein (TIGR03083 family)
VNNLEHRGAYASTRARINDLLAGIDDAGAATVVPACPAWTVADLTAHLAGVARALVERDRPGPDVQAWVDAQVAARQGRSVDSLLDEWNEFAAPFEDLIESKGGSFGFLLYDIVAHEHDLRGALQQPGARSSDGVTLALAIGRTLLERDLTANGLGAVQVRSADGDWSAGTGEPALTLDLSDQPHGTWELFRLLGSRRSEAQLARYSWTGDWKAMLPGLAHMDLPNSDIVE